MKMIKGYKVYVLKGEKKFSLPDDEDALEYGFHTRTSTEICSEKKYYNFFFIDKYREYTVKKYCPNRDTIRKMIVDV
jgi:hypothetical protein